MIEYKTHDNIYRVKVYTLQKKLKLKYFCE